MRIAYLMLGISCLCASVGNVLARDSAKPAYSATLTRTQYGIPHINAKDEASAAYGLGYAYAQDNSCLFLETLLTMRGERSLYFDPEAVDGPLVATSYFFSKNISSDLFFKWLNDDAAVASLWSKQPPVVQASLKGYAAGFNRGVAELRAAGKLPKACATAAWAARDIEVNDVVRLIRFYTVGPFGEYVEYLLAAAPPAAGSVPTTSALRADWAERAGEAFGTKLASNGVAFGRDITENRRGVLLANPHFPWNGTLRFYEFHVTVPGQVDVMGSSLAGLPYVAIGFTKQFAWTHTVNTSSHYTLHALKLDPADATKYIVDGVSKPLTRKSVTVTVADKSGAKKVVSRDFWESEHGPIVAIKGKLDWTAASAFALRDANFSNTRILETWRGINRARSLQELEDVTRTVVGLPWVNLIAVDAGGTALYANYSVIPDISDAQVESCVAAPFKPMLAGRKYMMFVLDGSRATCNWQSAPAAMQPGIVPADRLPVLRRTDYVQNSNDSAWLSNPAAPLVNFPLIVSGADYPQNGRTRLGITQLREVIDGKTGGRFSVESIKTMVLNNRSYAAPMLRESLQAVCTPDFTASAACAVLTKWDGTANLDSVGYPLAQMWLRDLAGKPEVWAKPFDARDPVNTPWGLLVDKPERVKIVQASLVRALETVEKAGIDITRPWGEVQRSARGGKIIPVHGGDTDDVYNQMGGRPVRGVKDVTAGSSYVSVVTFDGKGPVAEAVLSYSQSSDPESPHSADQTELFSKKAWVKLPFTPAQIKAQAIAKPVSLQQ